MPGATQSQMFDDPLKSKPLPDLPPPTPLRLTPASQRVNTFIPGNCPPASPSSKFHPKKRSISVKYNPKLKPCALYRVDSQVDERAWIRGGSSSVPSTRPASPDEVKEQYQLGLGIFTHSGMLLPELVFPSTFGPNFVEESYDSSGILLSSDKRSSPMLATSSRIPTPSRQLSVTSGPFSNDSSAIDKHTRNRPLAPTKPRPKPCSTRMRSRKLTSTSLSGFYASVSRTSRVPRPARMSTLSRTSSIATSRSPSRGFSVPRRIVPNRSKIKPKSNQADRKPDLVGRVNLHHDHAIRTPRASSSAYKSPRTATGTALGGLSRSDVSPSLAVTSQAKLKRRKRVRKQPSLLKQDTKQYDFNANVDTSAPAHSTRWRQSAVQDSSKTPRPSANLRNFSLTRPQHVQDIVTHSLPLILPANQDYQCHVEWESEEVVEVDAAETLWRQLELECGMNTQQGLTSPKRGRWRVKVVRELEVDSASEDGVSMARNSTDDTENLNTFSMIGEERFVGVLREVDDILPSVHDFSNLAETLRKSPDKQQTSLLKKSNSRKVVHSDLKRALGSVWEECDQAEASEWSAQLALLKSHSVSRSILEESQTEWQNQGRNVCWSSGKDVASNMVGEPLTMSHSESYVGNSVVEMYL